VRTKDRDRQDIGIGKIRQPSFQLARARTLIVTAVTRNGLHKRSLATVINGGRTLGVRTVIHSQRRNETSSTCFTSPWTFRGVSDAPPTALQPHHPETPSIRVLTIRWLGPSSLPTSREGSKMPQLIPFGENGSAALVHPCRQVNVRESFPMIASFVEEICDWDVPDSDLARTLAIKVLPSSNPTLVLQYRESMRSSRRFLDTDNPHRRYHSIITKQDTGVCTIRPSGPLGAILVRFRPEASALFFAHPLEYFSDVKVDLDDVFDSHEVALLEEVVAEAPTSSERVAAVAQFLYAHMYQREPDPVICRAAACLRKTPSTRVHRLAADLDLSERQLLRRFRSAFGVTPKQFARCSRIEKVLRERTRGSAWADIACGCGFSDQAHMIKDFNIVVGASPERALLPASAEQGFMPGRSNGAPIAHDYLFW
jgi:AraC-like DNA-binding protein